MKTFSIYNENNHDYPIVISIPHSGTYISEEIKQQFIDDVVLPNTDWYLCDLYAFLKDMGFTVIENHVNRYVIDPNRSLKDNEGRSYQTNLVYKQTTLGYDIYKNELSQEEINERIHFYYLPYHQQIEKALKEKSKYFDKVYLIDLHSFSLDYQCDIILGNRQGMTCSQHFFETIQQLFTEEGFRVRDNDPFSGGYITQHYGLKDKWETLQIELWYQKYIEQRNFYNEEFPAINMTLFNQTQEQLKNVFRKLKNYF